MEMLKAKLRYKYRSLAVNIVRTEDLTACQPKYLVGVAPVAGFNWTARQKNSYVFLKYENVLQTRHSHG